MVEIHDIYANMTVKNIETTNATKKQFEKILENGKYKILGKIREGESSYS